MVQETIYCLKLFSEVLNVKISPEDVKRMLRLWKLEDNKCRPVLIEFCDRATKNLAMKSAPEL